MRGMAVGIYTPLSTAARKGHNDVVHLFLGRKDIEINSRNDAGNTPLLWLNGVGMG